jgi:hypothetical protein
MILDKQRRQRVRQGESQWQQWREKMGGGQCRRREDMKPLNGTMDEDSFGFVISRQTKYAFFQALLSGGGDCTIQAIIQAYFQAKCQTDTVDLEFAQMDADAKMYYVSTEHAITLLQNG